MAQMNPITNVDIDSLSIEFINIINDLFKSNGFECKTLSYSFGIFYCARDILKCLNYKEDKNSITKVLSKLNKTDKFTISELEEKHSKVSLKLHDASSSNPNQELINSLNQYELKHIYINKQALYRLIGSSKKEEAKPFQDFIYDILLPALDNHYQYIINRQKTSIDELTEKINILLSKHEETMVELEEIKDINIDIKDELQEANSNINELKYEQQELITVVEETLIPERNLTPFNNNLKHHFVIYKIKNDQYVFLRGQKSYIDRKLKSIPKESIVINHSYPNPIDFTNLFKEEIKRRDQILKQDIIQKLRAKDHKFRSTSQEGKKLINEEFNKLRGFSINLNILTLNNSTFEDVLEYYNNLINTKETY